MILVIDNYDSFTYNLVHLIGAAGATVDVVRNDAISVAAAIEKGPQGIVLSPGPCTPQDAGICMEMSTAAKRAGIPLLGVCLGHQSIVAAAGGAVIRAERLMHGRTSDITHDGQGLFAGIPSPFTVTRYHSLVARPTGLPADIRVAATATDDGEIMAAQWGDGPHWGVQFHPESIASQHGDIMIRNFLAMTNSDTVRAA